MNGYNTKAKALILTYLETHEGQFSSDELSKALIEVGKSTIYRLLPKLAKEGLIQKVVIDKRSLYSYLPKTCLNHLHAECTSCGHLIHLDEKTSHNLEEVLSTSGLFVDSKSVLPCLCKECQKKR